jgi:hypothetical protein
MTVSIWWLIAFWLGIAVPMSLVVILLAPFNDQWWVKPAVVLVFLTWPVSLPLLCVHGIIFELWGGRR